MKKFFIGYAFAILVVVKSNKNFKLYEASRDGNLTLVNEALAEGANPNWQEPNFMSTALIEAAVRNYVDIGVALLNMGADPNLQDNRGATPLNEAVHFGSADMVPLLLSYGADVNLADNDGQTPLLTTIHRNQVEMARVLLEHGADPNKQDSQGRTTVSRARSKGHKRLAELVENFDINTVTLVPIKQSLKFEPQASKDHMLFQSVEEGNLSLVTKLLASGANPNWQNTVLKERPAHMTASHKIYVEIALALLKGGADPNLQNSDGNAPLHAASYFGSAEVLPILISHGADINLQNNDGDTPLGKSVHSGKLGMANILLQNGADRNIKDKKNMTPAGLARDKGLINLANFIENFDIHKFTVVPANSSEISSSTVYPLDSTIKLSSIILPQTRKDIELIHAASGSSTELDSPTPPEESPSPKLSPGTSEQTHNLSLSNEIIIVCLVMASAIALIYLIVLAIKRHRVHQKEIKAICFDNAEEINIHL